MKCVMVSLKKSFFFFFSKRCDSFLFSFHVSILCYIHIFIHWVLQSERVQTTSKAMHFFVYALLEPLQRNVLFCCPLTSWYAIMFRFHNTVANAVPSRMYRAAQYVLLVVIEFSVLLELLLPFQLFIYNNLQLLLKEVLNLMRFLTWYFVHNSTCQTQCADAGSLSWI